MDTREITIAAPAKTNLSLHVTGKREDGFHGIETRMVRLALADQVTLRTIKGDGNIQFTCNDKSLPTDDSNLAVKAATIFQREFQHPLGIEISLSKKIPIGAGLGGGSSDAASVLLGLNQLFDADLSTERLSEMAAELGSDVPFFIYESSCDCSGRGEIVTPLDEETANSLQDLPILLIKPEFPVSAAFAYQKWADSKPIPGIFYGDQLTPWGTIVNELERPVFQKYLLLPRIKSWLLDQPEVRAAIMSGSGSTTLAIVSSHGRCHKLAKRAKKKFGDAMWIHPTKAL